MHSQNDLIRRWLPFYRELALEKRRPTTPAQEHFVEVCQGRAEPNTEHEKAYLTYMSNENEDRSREDERVRRKSLQKKREAVAHDRAVRDNPSSKPYARFFDEPLGTRDGFKRHIAKNRYDSS